MSKAIFVAGLAYGDEGKGATVDFLCRNLPVDLVVRYNGGSQAAHNVITSSGQHHTFSQFGSGSLAGDHVRTHLSRFMLVDPLTMMNEAEALHDKGVRPWKSTTVDPHCIIITPFHKQVNWMREEARGDARHGSCGMGVGVAREWYLRYGDSVLLAKDILNSNVVFDKLWFLRNLAYQEFGFTRIDVDDIEVHDIAYQYSRWPATLSTMPKTKLAVFEGAQGVLLDETHGEAPYHTWTDCTFNNADTLCDDAGVVDRFRIGCMRTYLTRHGAGPFERFDVPLGWEQHNVTNDWQGDFRAGPMNFSLIDKAVRCLGKVDAIALSHLDYVANPMLQHFSTQETLGIPVGIVALGPTATDRRFTPDWKAVYGQR